MTHYYLLIEESGVLTSESKIWKVAVGQSKQADRDFLFLLAHTADNGYYFEKITGAVAEFLYNIAVSVAPVGSESPIDYLNIRQVKARDLVRSIKKRTAIPLDSLLLQHQRAFRYLTNINFRTAGEIAKR